MALDQKFFKKSTAGSTDQEQGLFIYADANDVDSYDGDGSIWYDINSHEVNVPLVDKASNLQLHLNASNTTSYSGSGTTWTDLSGNDRHGTITDPVFESGLAGGLDFNSATGTSGDKVVVAHNAAFNQQNNMTFEVWLKRDGTTEDNIFYKGGASGDSYFFSWNPSYGYYFYTYVWGGGVYSGTSGLSTGVYEHVVITIDGSGNRKMYVNGTLSANNLNGNTTGTGTLTDTGPLTIGGYYPYAVHGGFDGRISVVRIYNTVLTAAEVGQNFRAGNNFNYSSIITSKHEATQGTLYTTNLNLSLDANNYSGSGDWQDGANDNDGVISGATYTNDGNSDYFDFDGSNDYINVAGSDLNPAYTKCIELWFNTDSTSEQYIISNNNGSGAYGYHMGVTSGKLFMWIYSQEQGHYHVNTSTGSSNTAAITVGEWNHAVWTMGPNASDNKIYLNGNLAYTESSIGGGTFPSTAAYNGINIGKYTSSGWFNGKLAQVRAYSTALTQAQITTNYNATKELYQNPAVLIDYRPNQYSGSGTSITNLGSLSNDAVLTGGIESTYDQELGDFFIIDGGSNTGDGIETTSNVTGVNLSSDGFSWEIWVNITSDSFSYITSFNYSTTYYNFSYRANTDTIMFFNLGTTLNTPTLQLNRWYHVVGTANSAGTKLYTNGVLSASNTTAAPNHNLNSKIYFGTYHSHSSGDHIHTGPLGDGRFYKGVLTAKQVVQNYLATKNKYPNGNNFTLYSPDFKNSSVPYYFRFNAANDEARVSSVDIDVSMGFTVSIYIKRHTAVSGYAQPFRITGTGYATYLFLIAGYNDQVYYSSSGTGNSLSTFGSSGNWTDNSSAWRNVIFTRESTPGSTTNRGEVYVNGSSHHSQTNLSAITNITNIYVNRDASYPTSRNAQCDVGLIKIWKKPFSDAEALAEYNATKDTYGL